MWQGPVEHGSSPHKHVRSSPTLAPNPPLLFFHPLADGRIDILLRDRPSDRSQLQLVKSVENALVSDQHPDREVGIIDIEIDNVPCLEVEMLTYGQRYRELAIG